MPQTPYSVTSPTARYLREPAAAKYVSLSVDSLSLMRGKGNGPSYIKLDRAVLYDREDLDAWLAARKVASTSEADRRAGR